MNFLKSLALFAFFFPILSFAEGGDHIAVGSRPPSEEVVAQTEEEAAMQNAPEEAPLEVAGYIFDRYPPVYYSNAHHRLVAVTVLDNGQYTLELEDGSIWKVNSYDGAKALNWFVDDALAITQNASWFHFFTQYYRIINKSNGTQVDASLFLGPIENGPYSRFIIYIDYSRREIRLNDNTNWEISYLDTSPFKDWALNDYIIIGTNSDTSIWDVGSDAILINVNMNNYTRAKQF